MPRLSMLLPLLSVALVACTSDVKSDSPDKNGVEIRFVDARIPTPEMLAEKQTLEELLHEYDLTDYLFTHELIIDPESVPHSHPILTVHVREGHQPRQLLSTFVHEQLHWFLDAHSAKTDQAIAEFKKMYPKIAVGFPKGAETADSSYLHIADNWLEYQALKRYLGVESARKTFAEKGYYKDLYSLVLQDEDVIGEVMRKYDLIVEKSPPLLRTASMFGEKRGCLMIADADTGKVLVESDPTVCAERISPCSTFKVPLAVMGFDDGVLQNADTTFYWDRKPQPRKEWEHDQTARSWLLNSVVWYSQRVTPRIGLVKMQSYLQDFDYGNQDFSGGITKAWLTSSLKISAREQIRFLTRMRDHQLSVKPQAIDQTMDILPVEIDRPGFKVEGKTGSGAGETRLGWYIGYWEMGSKHYAFALDFTANKAAPKGVYGGPEAKQMALKAFEESVRTAP